MRYAVYAVVAAFVIALPYLGVLPGWTLVARNGHGLHGAIAHRP